MTDIFSPVDESPPEPRRPLPWPTLVPRNYPEFTERLCAQSDLDLFFPERGQSVREAKAICALCADKPACLTYALEQPDEQGIWGGTTDQERIRLRRLPPVREVA